MDLPILQAHIMDPEEEMPGAQPALAQIRRPLKRWVFGRGKAAFGAGFESNERRVKKTRGFPAEYRVAAFVYRAGWLRTVRR